MTASRRDARPRMVTELRSDSGEEALASLQDVLQRENCPGGHSSKKGGMTTGYLLPPLRVGGILSGFGNRQNVFLKVGVKRVELYLVACLGPGGGTPALYGRRDARRYFASKSAQIISLSFRA